MIDSADSAIIRVKQLTKRYGDIVAVDSITFTVRRGEIFAFLGPNGAGKTTTIKMLTTLLVPTGGEIDERSRPGPGAGRGTPLFRHRFPGPQPG